MNICLKFGDTNFIGLVNSQKYTSFVHEDWDMDNRLEQHFGDEMRNGHILVYRMTDEGVEHSWNIKIDISLDVKEETHFRKAEGFIQVTANELYIVDYDCLTMCAQFMDTKLPDDNCKGNVIHVPNGNYKVTFYQYYNVDKNRFTGRDDIDIRMVLTEVLEWRDQPESVFFGTVHS